MGSYESEPPDASSEGAIMEHAFNAGVSGGSSFFLGGTALVLAVEGHPWFAGIAAIGAGVLGVLYGKESRIVDQLTRSGQQGSNPIE